MRMKRTRMARGTTRETPTRSMQTVLDRRGNANAKDRQVQRSVVVMMASRPE